MWKKFQIVNVKQNACDYVPVKRVLYFAMKTFRVILVYVKIENKLFKNFILSLTFSNLVERSNTDTRLQGIKTVSLRWNLRVLSHLNLWHVIDLWIYVSIMGRNIKKTLKDLRSTIDLVRRIV